MPWCPVCGKWFSTQLTLNGHIRLSTDQKHISHLGKPPIKRRYKVTQQKNFQDKLKKQAEEIKTLKSLLTQKKKEKTNNNENHLHPETESDNENQIQQLKELQKIRDEMKMIRESLENIINQKNIPKPTQPGEISLICTTPETIAETSSKEVDQSIQDLENLTEENNHEISDDLLILNNILNTIPQWKKIMNDINTYVKTGYFPYKDYQQPEKKKNNESIINEPTLPMKPIRNMLPRSNTSQTKK